MNNNESAAKPTPDLESSALNIYRLIRNQDFPLPKISHRVLNYIFTTGHLAGQSASLWIATDPKCIELLSDRNYILPRMINATTLNQVVINGKFAGASLAIFLFFTQQGRQILSANNYDLLHRVKPEAFAYIIPSGPFSGHTLLHMLTILKEARVMLDRCDLSSPEALNHIVPSGNYGLTAAHVLASSKEGWVVLAKYLSSITAECLNYIIPKGIYAGYSLAYVIARRKDSNYILMLENCSLLAKINPANLDYILAALPHDSKVELMANPYALEIIITRPDFLKFIATDNFALATKIAPNDINAIVRAGSYAGKPIACMLICMPGGKALLAAQQNRLANGINISILLDSIILANEKQDIHLQEMTCIAEYILTNLDVHQHIAEISNYLMMLNAIYLNLGEEYLDEKERVILPLLHKLSYSNILAGEPTMIFNSAMLFSRDAEMQNAVKSGKSLAELEMKALKPNLG